MNHKPIHNADDHARLLARAEELVALDPATDTPEGEELDLLATLIEHYELKHLRTLAKSAYPFDNAQQVFFYERNFYPLSNFAAFNLHWDGYIFPTSEHAYQYEKFSGHRRFQTEIREARSAHDAFKMAQAWHRDRRPDWEAVRIEIMREILHAKVNQHEYVRRKLLETGERELIEDSWRDDFWGWGPNYDERNQLGKLWMEIRAELRRQSP